MTENEPEPVFVKSVPAGSSGPWTVAAAFVVGSLGGVILSGFVDELWHRVLVRHSGDGGTLCLEIASIPAAAFALLIFRNKGRTVTWARALFLGLASPTITAVLLALPAGIAFIFGWRPGTGG